MYRLIAFSIQVDILQAFLLGPELRLKSHKASSSLMSDICAGDQGLLIEAHKTPYIFVYSALSCSLKYSSFSREQPF